MKYLFLLYDDVESASAAGSAEQAKQQQAYGEFYQDVAGRGAFQSGDPVQPATEALTIRVRQGKTESTQGPFTSGPEQLVGFYVLDCADRSEAIGYAQRIPAASTGTVEVRPILAM
jgi:hypothetical protein